MKPLISLLILLPLAGCTQREKFHEPTFSFTAINLNFGGIPHQVSYRLEEWYGEKFASPVIVFPRTADTEEWTLSLNHKTKEFFVGSSGKDVMPQDCPVVYLQPGSDYVCLGESLRGELHKLKLKEEAVDDTVYFLIESYLNPEAEQGGSVKPDKQAYRP